MTISTNTVVAVVAAAVAAVAAVVVVELVEVVVVHAVVMDLLRPILPTAQCSPRCKKEGHGAENTALLDVSSV